MNIYKIRQSLTEHEGSSNGMYLDSEGNPTIGIGHNLSKPISNDAIDIILDDDIAEAVRELDRTQATWRSHNDARQNILVEMMFSLGAPNLSGFKRMWKALAEQDYAAASEEMLSSKWATQVKGRAITLADRMRKG